jgi:hypothetical protein
MRLLILVVLIAFYVSDATASDGVLEINQACAAGPGCFPGDDPGFPVRIANSGSYVLTSNLVVPALVTGVTNETSPGNFPNNVSIALDLNGFRISSTTNCSGGPLVCSPSSVSSGNGVHFDILDHGAMLIQNGVIQGMAGYGVFCTGQCVVKDLVVSNNGQGGITASGSIRNVQAFRNGNGGIGLPQGAFNVGNIESCTSVENQGAGFFGGATFNNNNAQQNGTYGFYGNSGATFNGNKSFSDATGIYCNYCSLHNNLILNSTTAGIDFTSTSAVYGGNLIDTNGPNPVLNAELAIQSTVNNCAPASCP